MVAEQKPNCTDEEAHTWMNSVVPAVESIHGVNLYGLVLVASGRLPRGANGLVQVHETRQNFIEGTLHPVNLLMCPSQCVTNLPVPKPHTSELLSFSLTHSLIPSSPSPFLINVLMLFIMIFISSCSGNWCCSADGRLGYWQNSRGLRSSLQYSL